MPFFVPGVNTKTKNNMNETAVNGTLWHIPAFISDLDLGVNVAQNIAQYPLHHVTYAHGKFEVAMTNGLGGDAFTRKYITVFDF